MRLVFTAILGALILTMAAGSGTLPGSDGAGSADASTGTIRVFPNPRNTAWNANNFSLQIEAVFVATNTQCALIPNDPQSPTAPCGLGAFQFTLNWDTDDLSYASVVGGTMLASTGRTVDCFPAEVGPSSVAFQCVTYGQIPLGPQGGGLLAVVNLSPEVAGYGGQSTVTLSNTAYFDVQGNQFPASPLAGVVKFGVCADVNTPPDGGVDLQDVLAILRHFGEVPPSNPKWDPNLDGSVDLQDALFALGEFGQACTYP